MKAKYLYELRLGRRLKKRLANKQSQKNKFETCKACRLHLNKCATKIFSENNIPEKSKEEVEYEFRLRRRLKILLEHFEAGKIKIADGLDVEKSLLAVRVGTDGEVDLDTVDGAVRSMALAVTAMHDREELKKEATLSEIQNMYFTFIENNFGHFYEIMQKKGLSPHDVGRSLSKNQTDIDNLTNSVNEFMGFIDQFWETFGEIAHIHVEDMHGNIKGILEVIFSRHITKT